MGTKHKIEPRLPGFAGVKRGGRRFPNASAYGLPRAANQPLRAIRRSLRAGQHHCPVFKSSFYSKQLTFISRPALMPNSSRRIVQTQTLSFQAVCTFIVLAQDAAIEYAIHASPRDDGCLAGLEGVPVTEPEIKLPVLRTRTEGWFCGLLCRRVGGRLTLDCCKQGKNKNETDLRPPSCLLHCARLLCCIRIRYCLPARGGRGEVLECICLRRVLGV